MLASGGQQSESVVHLSTLFKIPFLDRLLQSIEQSCLCYTVGPYSSVCVSVSTFPLIPALAYPS